MVVILLGMVREVIGLAKKAELLMTRIPSERVKLVKAALENALAATDTIGSPSALVEGMVRFLTLLS